MLRSRRSILVALLAASCALLAGCGGGGGGPGVASVGGATTTSTTTAQGPAGGSQQGTDVPKGARFSIAMNTGSAELGAKFSACMRKHGVTSFPDPDSHGVIQFGSDSGIDPRSPTFTSARSACDKLLPNGGRPTPQQQAQMQQKMLAFSQCMRAHGIHDFPDPTSGGIRLHAGPGSDLDPGNPRFAAAQQACQKDLPFKGGGVRTAK